MQNVEDQIYYKLILSKMIIFMKVSSLIKLIYLKNSKNILQFIFEFLFRNKNFILLGLADTNE